MKKILALTACVVPLMVAPAIHAQTSTAPSTAPSAGDGSAPASTMPGSPGSPSTGAGTSGTAAPGMSTPPAAPGATTAPSGADDTSTSATATQAITGVSVKEKIGQAVYNEKDEKIGDIEDVVLAMDGQATTYVIGAGGFLGMGQHSVAVPFDKVTESNDKLMLQGYTKDQLKALPEVKVAK